MNEMPLGGSKPVEVDVRLVSATNKELQQAIRDGAFREDLYFRLAGVTLFVPSLLLMMKVSSAPPLPWVFSSRLCSVVRPLTREAYKRI